jgi:protein-disulfide isomerase
MTPGRVHLDRRRVYYTVALALALAGSASVASRPAAGPVDLKVDPAMTKGTADAPVTIVEFSDYQ